LPEQEFPDDWDAHVRAAVGEEAEHLSLGFYKCRGSWDVYSCPFNYWKSWDRGIRLW
jgi:hypothetical protein